MTVTVNLTNLTAAQPVQLYTNTGSFASGTSTTGTVTGNGLSVLTFTPTAAGNHVFTGTYTCVASAVVTFTASGAGGTVPSGSAVVTCGAGTTTALTVTPAAAALNQQVQVIGTCAAGGQQLTASAPAFGNSPAPTNGTVVAPQIVQCNAAGQLVAYFYCSAAANVSFTLAGATGNLSCGTGAGAGGIVASPPSVAVNQTANITGNCVGSQLVTSSAGGQFSSVISGASYTSPNSITCAGGVFSATFLCGPAPATIQFTSGLQTGTLGCGVAAGSGLQLNPPGGGTTTSVTGQCTVPGTQLTSSGPGAFISASINGANVPGVQGSPVINCSQVGTLTGVFNCTAPGAVTFNLAGLVGAFSCTAPGQSCLLPAVFNPATGQCTGGTGGVAATVTITANPSSLQCSGSASVAFMSVAVKDAAGANVADGTNVTITADSGTFAPSQATTLGGATQFIYSPASTSSGTVSIRANAGNAQGTATVNVSCNTQTAAPPVSAPVTSPPPPPAGPIMIAPPNTGDAGLATATDNTWQLYAATAILMAVTAGAVAVAKAKAER